MYFIIAAVLVLASVPFARKIRQINCMLISHKYMMPQQRLLKRQRRLCAVALLGLCAAAMVELALKG